MDSTAELAPCQTHRCCDQAVRTLFSTADAMELQRSDVSDPPDGMQDQHEALDRPCDRTVRHAERYAARPLWLPNGYAS
jgi:hypothetical protein